ncbi:hypothetical protein [Synechococcus sp. MIT S1220]|uniref:hypothetical protein n=1 Tax=Synechococcus sp. MIT S1220 TaxID=3082549 RepID=UPI0039B01161
MKKGWINPVVRQEFPNRLKWQRIGEVVLHACWGDSSSYRPSRRLVRADLQKLCNVLVLVEARWKPVGKRPSR